MAEVNHNSRSGGIGFVGLLTIVFITLKLCGVLAWSWWWVLSPLWISALMFIGVLLVAVPVIGFMLYLKEQRKLLVALTTSLLASAVPTARAADCRQFFQTKQVYAAPVVAYAVPQVIYQAGVGIEQDALAAKVAKLVTAQLRAELNTAPLKQAAPTSALAQHCGRCHSGANPKQGLTIDGSTTLDCHSVLAAIRAVASDKMPPNSRLTPQQKGQLLDELLALEQPALTQPADKPHAIPVPPEPGELP